VKTDGGLERSGRTDGKLQDHKEARELWEKISIRGPAADPGVQYDTPQ